VAGGVAAQVATCPRAPDCVAGWARGPATMLWAASPTTAVRRWWPCRERPCRAWPWRGVAELRHAAVRRCGGRPGRPAAPVSRGVVTGRDVPACKWLTEEGGHHELGEAGTQLARDEPVKVVLCGRYPLLARYGSEIGPPPPSSAGYSPRSTVCTRQEYREVDLGEYTRRGRRAMQAACVLRRLATTRVLAEHGPPRLTWGKLKVLRNPHWSKLTSGVMFAACGRVLADRSNREGGSVSVNHQPRSL
jgi:hypothetical protein